MVSPALRTLLDAAPVRLPVTFPVKFAVTTPAEKFPDASLLTKALTVLLAVALLASWVAALIFAAVEPPTFATVAEALPEPEAATSPVRAVM
jgi:hypothetical protein